MSPIAEASSVHTLLPLSSSRSRRRPKDSIESTEEDDDEDGGGGGTSDAGSSRNHLHSHPIHHRSGLLVVDGGVVLRRKMRSLLNLRPKKKNIRSWISGALTFLIVTTIILKMMLMHSLNSKTAELKRNDFLIYPLNRNDFLIHPKKRNHLIHPMKRNDFLIHPVKKKDFLLNTDLVNNSQEYIAEEESEENSNEVRQAMRDFLVRIPLSF